MRGLPDTLAISRKLPAYPDYYISFFWVCCGCDKIKNSRCLLQQFHNQLLHSDQGANYMYVTLQGLRNQEPLLTCNIPWVMICVKHSIELHFICFELFQEWFRSKTAHGTRVLDNRPISCCFGENFANWRCIRKQQQQRKEILCKVHWRLATRMKTAYNLTREVINNSRSK